MTRNGMINILMADDDHDDCDMVQEAVEKAEIKSRLFTVHDGEQLLHYLRREKDFADVSQYPLPDIILLDLNMPKMDGRDALREIRLNDQHGYIPVVVFSTSREPSDVYELYNLGANSYVMKPDSFEELVDLMGMLYKYWQTVAQLPIKNN